MKLPEYKAHELFRTFAIPCLDGCVAHSVEELPSLAARVSYPIVIKAQVLTGGRGKAGGVRIAEDAEELIALGSQIFALSISGQKVPALFLTGKRQVKQEYYASMILDRKRKCPVLIFSSAGGMEINETAEKAPDKVITVSLDPQTGIQAFTVQYIADRAAVGQAYHGQLRKILEGLFRLFMEYDCLLAEINPLAFDGEDRFVALDGKIEIDDNSLFRHPDMRAFRDESCSDPLVLKARGFGFLYIPVDEHGDVGVISNGSGMIMSSMDLLSQSNSRVACALDLGGGATADRIYEAVRVMISNPAVKLIFINIFGGITRCNEVASGVVRAVAENPRQNFVVRMEGTNKEEGVRICSAVPRGIELVDGLGEAIPVITRLLTTASGTQKGRGVRT